MLLLMIIIRPVDPVIVLLRLYPREIIASWTRFIFKDVHYSTVLFINLKLLSNLKKTITNNAKC